MKKNFILNNKKMVYYQISNATIIMSQGDAQSNIGKYTLRIIRHELNTIITRYLRGPSKPLYKEMKKLLRTLQKNSSFHFGYTICHPTDTFDHNTGYKHALHNYLESQK